MTPSAPITLPMLHCLRCHWQWYPRRAMVPRRCPHCKTLYWQTPRAVRAST